MKYSIVLTDGNSIDCFSYRVVPEGVEYSLKSAKGRKKNGETFLKDVPLGFVPCGEYKRVVVITTKALA